MESLPLLNIFSFTSATAAIKKIFIYLPKKMVKFSAMPI